jgi:2'-5' RNA ligase
MRLFVALDIAEAIRERITRFAEGVPGIRARCTLG